MSCFQCALDIPHVCYAGIPNARWGMTDEAVAALEGAQRLGFMLTPEKWREWRDQQPQEQQRAPRKAPKASTKRRRAR